MPKASININDFGRGINTVKNPRDLAIGESPNIVNFDTSNRGELRPRSYFNEQTNGSSLRLGSNGVDAHTASINPGYGLYYFEADEAIGLRGVTFTASGAVSSTTNAGSNIVFNAANDVIYINNNDFWTENNILSSTTSFPVKIKISGTSNNNGTFTVTGLTGVETDPEGFTIQGSTWNVSGDLQNAAIKVSEDLTDENVAASTSVTIQRIGLVGDQLLALGNIDDSKVDIYSDSSDAWAADKVTVVNTLDSGEKPEYVFYYIDSSLRVADANFRNESTPKWYGFIDRNQFQYNIGTSTENVWRTITPGFYEESNDLAPPTSVNKISTSSMDGSAEFPASGAGWNIAVIETDEEGEFSPGDYEFCGTFIYDGNQESLITKDNTNTKTLEGFKKLKFNVFARDDRTSRYDRRITGGRIYFREADSRDPWVLFADIDIRRGVRASLVDEYKGWIEDDTGGVLLGQFRVTTDTTTGHRGSAYWHLFAQRPNIDTYESLNGYSPNDTKQIAFGKIGSGYKTAVVANRRTFVANVLYDDNATSSSDDNTDFQHYGDRIMFSEVGKYDLFPNFNFIDVVKGDGEDYVRLESYADRLLAYKQRTLQILNVSSPSPSNWFLETTIQEGGVTKPYSVCKGRGGVIWANKSGVYRYDGSSVKKVTDGKIKDSEWKTFSASDKMSLGYIGDTDQVIIVPRVDGGSSSYGDAYIYDIRNDSFVLSEDIHPNQTSSFKPSLTNFVNDSEGKLIVGYDVDSTDLGGAGANKVHFTPWNEGEGTHKIYKLETPDLSFAEPHRTKKVYKIYVHYKYTHSDNGIAYNEPITKSNVYYRANQRGSWKNVTSGSMENSENVLRNGNFDRYWLGWNDIFNDSSSNEITDWTFVSDGSGGRKAKFTATGSPSIVLTNKEIIDGGLTYNTKFTVSDYSAGNVKLNVGGVAGTARTANGTHSESFSPSSDGYLMISCSNDFVGSIDDIIVRPTSSRESYGVAVFELEDTRGVRCQSMAFKIETSLTNASKLHINDIQVEYRVLQNRVF
tara:strand:- start:2625 stop:5699 length:3075 start_codon:yes stop_codon:yes gene_type:complete